MNKTMSPFVMIIFGATGDLTARKLMPALLSMFSEGFLGEKFYIVGVARRPLSNEDFRKKMRENIEKFGGDKRKGKGWESFSKNLYYQQGNFADSDTYDQLVKKLNEFDKETGACIIRFFYLATPPSNYSVIIGKLESSKLSEGCGQGGNKWTRILIEKPFGIDASSSKILEEKLSHTFEEKQIYRIDHYLGKEAIQNIIAFRFANGIFEPIWNKDYVDHVQITMAEKIGVEGRIGFYEGIGALRDVVQNHMLSMLALVSMEQPKSFSAESVREERCKAVSAIKIIDEKEVAEYVVRGQYGGGRTLFGSPSSRVLSRLSLAASAHSQASLRASGSPSRRATRLDLSNNSSCVGYRQENGVDPNSMTETYVAMKVFVERDRWQGIPWYLRTGKRLKRDAVEISVVFKQTCHILFREIGCPEEGNILTLRISPNEGIGVRFIIKAPGHEFKLTEADMDFDYKKSFGAEGLEAYERILEEIFRADQMLFNRSDEMAASWRFIDPILNAWKKEKAVNFPNYNVGSWGPKEGDELIERDGRKWVLK